MLVEIIVTLLILTISSISCRSGSSCEAGRSLPGVAECPSRCTPGAAHEPFEKLRRPSVGSTGEPEFCGSRFSLWFRV